MTTRCLYPLVYFLLLTVLVSCIAQDQHTTIAAQTSALLNTDTGKTVWIIFLDSRNSYWFGSQGQGVYRDDGKTVKMLLIIPSVTAHKPLRAFPCIWTNRAACGLQPMKTAFTGLTETHLRNLNSESTA